ncbi:MAG: hypothetical protein ACLGIO_11300 [Acidimicrobiia bacterium]
MRRRRRGAVVLAAALCLATAGPARAATAQPGPGLDACNLPVVGAVCELGDALGAVGQAVASVPATVAEGALGALSSWVASGAAGLLSSAGQAILSGTQPRLSGTGEGGRAWFLQRYDDLALISLGLFAPMLILAVVHGVVTGSAGLVGRAVANLPVAALGTAAAVVVVEALLGAVDAASVFAARSLGADTENFLSGMAALVVSAVAGPGGAAAFGAVLLAVLMALVALVVWLELVVREAAVYLTVAFLPLGFATYIWPALSPWLRRLLEVIVALVLSKLVIVVALSLAGSGLAAQEGFGALVGAAGMLLLAAFAPFALFKLIPVASMATLSSLEGQGRRAVRAATPRMSSVFYARQLAGGGARRGPRTAAPAARTVAPAGATRAAAAAGPATAATAMAAGPARAARRVATKGPAATPGPPLAAPTRRPPPPDPPAAPARRDRR